MRDTPDNLSSKIQPAVIGRPTVLSTKKLSQGQRELLLNCGIGLVEVNFISIVPLPFEISKVAQNIIFTSQNAVQVVLKHPLKKQFQAKNIFCIGEKTANLLRKNGFRLVKTANYGAELASEIVKEHGEEDFTFFCGSKRHDALPKGLKSAGVNFTEVEVYDTQLTSKKLDRSFDGVLFFSPSGVKSYSLENDLAGTVAFCIGRTTSSEAQKYSDNIITASTPSIESLIVQVVKFFKKRTFKND